MIPISMTSALIDIIFICFYILYNVKNIHKTDTESQEVSKEGSEIRAQQILLRVSSLKQFCRGL